MRKPWFKSVTFWTGLIASVVIGGPFAVHVAALWCAGFAAYRATTRNQRPNTDYGRPPYNTGHNRQEHNPPEKGHDEKARRQEQKPPHNPYHKQASHSPSNTPSNPNPKVPGNTKHR